MDTQEIKPRTVIPLSDHPGRVINVSRNVIRFICGLTPTQTNVIVAIIDALFRGLQYGTSIVEHISDIMIPIPFDVISGARDRRRLLGEVEKLITKTIKFEYPVPGATCDITTTVVSAVIRRDGRIYVTVPATSLPFYLFCGSTVGFAAVERDVLLRLPSTTQKLLHLLIAEKIDNKKRTGVLRMSPAELAQALGLPETCSFSQLRTNVIKPYLASIGRLHSQYEVNYLAVSARGGHRGHPAVAELRLTAMQRHSSFSTAYEVVCDFLRPYADFFSETGMTAVAITNALESDDHLDNFAAKIDRIMRQRERNGKKEVKKHTANTIKKILSQDYHINL